MSLVDKKSFCPFCSLFDPLILRVPNIKSAYFTKDSLWRLDYPTEPNYGLCPRGNYSLYFIEDNRRAYAGMLGGKERRVFEVVSRAVERLKESKNKTGAIVIDGTLSLDDAYLVTELAKLLNINCVCLNPIEDEFIGRNSTFGYFNREELAEADFILVFGDPFSSNPTISKQILDSKLHVRGSRFCVVSSYPSKTSEHATRFINVKVGAEGVFAVAIAKALDGESFKREADLCGVSVDDVAWVVEGIRNAKKAFVILSGVLGQFFGLGELARVLSLVAEKTSAKFLPLTQARNSIGISGIVANAGLEGYELLSELARANRLQYLISFGVIPEIILPSEVIRNLEFIFEAHWFIPEKETRYDFFVPIATPFETSGFGMTSFGELIEYNEVVSPPGDAVSVRKVLETMFFQFGRTVSVSKDFIVGLARGFKTTEPDYEKIVSACERFSARKNGFLAIFTPTSFQVGDGSVTNRISFAKSADSLPKLEISTELVERFGHKVRIKRADNVSLELDTTENNRLKGNVLLLSSNYTKYREFLPKLEPPADIGPLVVEIEKVSELKEAQGE